MRSCRLPLACCRLRFIFCSLTMGVLAWLIPTNTRTFPFVKKNIQGIIGVTIQVVHFAVLDPTLYKMMFMTILLIRMLICCYNHLWPIVLGIFWACSASRSLHFLVSESSLYKMNRIISYQDTFAARDPFASAAAPSGGSAFAAPLSDSSCSFNFFSASASQAKASQYRGEGQYSNGCWNGSHRYQKNPKDIYQIIKFAN